MLKPNHLFKKKPMVATIIPPNKKYAIVSEDPALIDKEKLCIEIIAYSIMLSLNLAVKRKS